MMPSGLMIEPAPAIGAVSVKAAGRHEMAQKHFNIFWRHRI